MGDLEEGITWPCPAIHLPTTKFIPPQILFSTNVENAKLFETMVIINAKRIGRLVDISSML